MTVSQAKALFDEGRLGPAIEELTRGVKADPSDTGLRTFLFELLCFAGDWDRAERQLDVIGHQDGRAAVGAQAYRNNIHAERERRRLFVDGIHPHFLTEPPPYADLLLAAVGSLREGDAVGVRSALGRAEDERPRLAGRMNGRPFRDFRDADDFVGPVLELFVGGKYAWLPFEQIRKVEIAAPQSLRDLVWARARIESVDGTAGEVFVPTLYAESGVHADDRVRLGRMTEWEEAGEDLYRAAGLRLFTLDEQEKQMFEAREIEFDAPAA
jgi:type VI secretion system protein ImpE